MSNSILILLDAYGEMIRINSDKIISYKQFGHFTLINCPYGQDIQVQCSVEELDKAFSENYFMIKNVASTKHNV